MRGLGSILAVAVLLVLSGLVGGCHSGGEKKEAVPASENGVAEQKKAVAAVPAKDGRIMPDYRGKVGGSDPIEGFNRSMAAVNYVGFRWVFRPIGGFWASIMPRHAIECFNRFCDNVAFPRRMFSCALQGKFGGSGIVLTRFLTNTTIGIAGFYDPAWNWFELERRNEDFGQAFASWGIGEGCYVTLPLEGPTTVRDGVGLIFDYALDPKTYIYGGQWFSKLNKGSYAYRDMDNVSRSYADPYELIKSYYYLNRYVLIHDLDRYGAAEAKFPVVRGKPDQVTEVAAVEIIGADRRDGYVETLLVGKVVPQRDQESMWIDLSLWNSDFFYQGSVRSVSLFKDRPDMDYKVWLQKKKDAPLAVVLPGTGAFYTNMVATALAEMMYDQGYSVAVLNGAMNWQFVESASSVPVPGFTPVDAADARKAVAAVIADLEKNRERRFPRRVMLGFSMGGMHTLFIAAMEKKEPLLRIDRYLAINPPVTLSHAMKQIDKCIAAWKKWDEAQIFPHVAVAVEKFGAMSRRNLKPFDGADVAVHEQAMGARLKTSAPTPDDQQRPVPARNADYLPFDRTEAKMMVGLAFKMTLDEVIMTIHHRHDFGILKTPYRWGSRTQLYQELQGFNFEKYASTFMVKYYSEREKRGVTVPELSRRASLPAIAGELRDDGRIRIIHTANDFLENAEDRRWLAETFRGRCIFFRDGGHVGGVFYRQVQDQIREAAGGVAAAK